MEQTSAFSLMFETLGRMPGRPVENSSENEAVRRGLSEKLFASQCLAKCPVSLALWVFTGFLCCQVIRLVQK